MWPSGVEENNDNRVCISSSKSSSSSSSHTLFSDSSLLQTPRRKSMEEVWKDINLASLHDNPTREELGLPKSNHSTHRGMFFQDFLARPFNKDPPTSATASIEPTSTRGRNFFDSSVPPPPIVLSLNSGPEFQFLDNTDPLSSHSQSQNHDSAAAASYISSLDTTPFDAFASSPSFSFYKKRVPEIDDNSGDRRRKRMIKNRESAARSRARKQAYTNELELEVAQLTEENRKLKKQQRRLYLSTAAQLPKKHSLFRTSTAPF